MTNDGGPAVDTSRDTSEQARAYLIRNVIVPLHPTCVPLPDLMGICTQVHNITAGLKAERDAAIAERDALRDEWEEIAAGITTEQPEVGALWPMVSEVSGNLAAARNLFRNEVVAHNRTKAERDRLREALEKAAIAAEVESAGHAIAIIEDALTSAKEG